MNDTIAAVAASGGPIGIIRVSGAQAIGAVSAVFSPKNGSPLAEAASQKLVYGTLSDKNGHLLDACYAVVFRAPHTYTGEDMAEIQCHGSTAVLTAALDALFAHGVRQAEAGEFTRRAFLNDKMGLSEAEAVHDLITARTVEAAQNAAAQMMGAVGSSVQQMRDKLLGMVAHFHAIVDFPDEDIDPILFDDAAALLHQTTSQLYRMAESYERGRILREGVPCVILGRPNAGKSTLLSVVSAAKPKIANYAFTTLEPNLGIVECRDGKSFVMADIPGIIEGAHEGRGLGLRFLRHIERNSVLLFMVPADADDIRREYEILLGELTQYNPELLDKQRLLAVTKSDMLDEQLIAEMRTHLPEGIPALFISSVTGYNIPQLKDLLWEALHK